MTGIIIYIVIIVVSFVAVLISGGNDGEAHIH